MQYSKFQSDIFEAIESNNSNIVVEAVPGSGKTTTLEIANSILPRNVKILNASFNKHIAVELRKRLPIYREAATLNSLGWGIIRDNNRNAILNEAKEFNYVRQFFNLDKWVEKMNFFKIVRKVEKGVNLLKYLNYQTFPDNFVQLFDTYGLEFELENNYEEYLRQTFDFSINDVSSYSFTDQVYQVGRQGYSIKKRDILFLDECQDLSPMEIDFSLKLANRSIAVGDRNQSIYVFRGADINAIPNIIKATFALELPLSICYRCDKAIIREAQKYVPHIEWRDDAEEGIVDRINKKQFYEMVTDGDLVTCRTTAPLVHECIKRLRSGKLGFVRGRDIGKSAYELVQTIKAKNSVLDINKFLTLLSEYQTKNVSSLTDQGRDVEAQAIDDKCQMLQAASIGCSNTNDLEHNLDELFSDENKEGVEFTTIHKAKGREADRVFAIRSDLCPHPKTPEHLMQIEHNLKLVEITRAKHQFYYVNKDPNEK